MFEKFDEAASDVLAASRHECIRLRCTEVLPEHLLLALTRDSENIAARALSSMNIQSDNVLKEVERCMLSQGKVAPEPPSGLSVMTPYENIVFSAAVRHIFERANDFRLYFGRDKVAPEHLLLGMLDLNEEVCATDPQSCVHLLEELGANMLFLRRQVMKLIAKDDSLNPKAPAAAPTVISGVGQIVCQHVDSIFDLSRLAESTGTHLPKLPDRSEVVLMVFLAYLPDFLLTQVAYQRYLLEETLTLLHQRTGPIDKELTATIVSQAAQNLRAEVRSIIDHLWSQEYRMLTQVPDEAEHEEIGSVIEDLWWTYSEEIALHEVFDEALDDYRRKHVLNLQKRKIEISQRLASIKQRLEQVLRQTFQKRTLSA